MAVRRSRPGPARPFVTRRSTLAFSAICVLAIAGFQAMGTTGGTGATGIVAASLASLAMVAGLVAWIDGVVLAVRARSVVWTVLAALPLPPLNAVVCAMFCPVAPGERR